MAIHQNTISLFLSYAHEDEPLLVELVKHLSLLKRQELISTWYDRQITPGTNWAKVIDERLKQASIILLLVSPDFLASDYCYQIEMKCALERHEAGQARVIPIAVRPADWKGAPFAYLQALPIDAKAITTWGNQDEALIKVVAGIRRAIEDLSLLPANTLRAALPAIWNIPYSRNSFFLGRDDVLSHLHTQLQAGQVTALSQPPQAISGLGGIGKTQIAVEYAYRYYQEYQAVLWVRSDTHEAIVSDYVAVAKLLNLPQRDEQDQSIIVDAVLQWFKTHAQWLLILDNADDLSIVRKFLPQVFGGHIILTTRAHAMGRLAHLIEVNTMELDVGALLLLRRAGLVVHDGSLKSTSLSDRAIAKKIAEELGGLPLALDQAGSYIEETQCSLSQYLQHYRTYRTALLHRRGGLVMDHPEPVTTTWSLSFEKIGQSNLAAVDLLRACSFLQPDAIPEEILLEGAQHLGSEFQALSADPLAFERAVNTLLSYSLIRRNPKGSLFTIHRLVQAVIKDEMDTLMYRMWAERIVQAVETTLPRVDYRTILRYERCFTHAQGCVLLISQLQLTSSVATSLLHKLGEYLALRGRYTEAETLIQQCLQIWVRTLGFEHSTVAIGLGDLARLYVAQGKYVEAEQLNLQALRIREQASGSEHPDIVYSLESLADCYNDQGKYAKAEQYYLRALLIQEQALGSEHSDTAFLLNALAVCYNDQGRYVEAEQFALRSLRIHEQVSGSEHPDIVHSLGNLASSYVEQGKYAEAEQYYLRALHIQEQALGSEHPDTALLFDHLAYYYHTQGKYAESEQYYLRALHSMGQTLGPEHFLTRQVRKNYALFLRTMKRDGEANKLEEKP